MQVDIFKECSGCNVMWKDLDSFLQDPDIQVVGFQPHFRDSAKGLFLFNHACTSTIALKSATLKELLAVLSPDAKTADVKTADVKTADVKTADVPNRQPDIHLVSINMKLQAENGGWVEQVLQTLKAYPKAVGSIA